MRPHPCSVAVALLTCLLVPLALAGQTAHDGASLSTATAVRLPDAATLRVDGHLEEAIWREAPALSGFTLREPVEGAPAPEATDVRFLYTDDALYIGARLQSAHPDRLRALIARRDRDVPSEQLQISFDPRLDRTTAYTFAITPGGVRSEWFHASDREDARDASFDPVWEAATAIGPDGWSAELRIPFSQVRYNAGSTQVWGVNVARVVPERNEHAFWVLVPRDAIGWSSRMGRLVGLQDIGGARRVEVLPYLAAGATRRDRVDPADPFADRMRGDARVGADVKIGLGPSLTLDATINPDFGQVEADPAEVNLSAFETFFRERRPFFQEGANLFGGRGTFYSRRIGASPPLTPDAPYAQRPDNTTILGAAKVTGRLPSGLSLGVLGAITAEEAVDTFDPATDAFGRTAVAPRTGYGVITARQEIGADASTVGVVLTGVQRALEPGSALAELLPRHAVSGLIDGRWRWAGGRYDVSAYLGFSRVSGDSLAILRQQRSSRRFFQRPDATHVDVDPGRTVLDGVMAGINHSKMAGAWLWDLDYSYESPGLELNDIGQLGGTDDHRLVTNLQYRETVPGRRLHAWNLGTFGAHEWNGGGVRTSSTLTLYGGITWTNFWRTELELGWRPPSLSDDLTRGGPLIRSPSRTSLAAELSNRAGARTRWEVNVDVAADALDGWLWATRGSLSIRPGTRWELSLQPGFVRRVEPQQYLATRAGGPTSTFGSRYVFARLDRSELVTRIRASYALQPDLTFEAYLEPFAASGHADRIGELQAARGNDRRVYGSGGSQLIREADGDYRIHDGEASFTLPGIDFDVRSFRSNLVLRWEWRPGSTLFLVWQQDRFQDGLPAGRVGPGGLLDATTTPGDHFFALKASYWLPF